jgi:hypothetical protein
MHPSQAVVPKGAETPARAALCYVKSRKKQTVGHTQNSMDSQSSLAASPAILALLVLANDPSCALFLLLHCTLQTSTSRHRGASSRPRKQPAINAGAPGSAARPTTSSSSRRSSTSGMQRAVLLQGKEVLLLAQVPDAAKHAAACWVPC